MKYLNDEECLSLLRKYGIPENIIIHCTEVRDVALRIAGDIMSSGTKIDIGLLRTAALLHDIGYWKYLRENGMSHLNHLHNYETGRLLRELGYDKIAEVAEQHMDISRDELRILGVPDPHDMIPVSLEAKIILIADKSRKGMNSVEDIFNYMEDERLEKRYFSKCPGMKQRILKDTLDIWDELVSLGMIEEK